MLISIDAYNIPQPAIQVFKNGGLRVSIPGLLYKIIIIHNL